MFDVLTHGFQDAVLKLKGQARLSESNITEALDAVRKSLLDADVDYGVVKSFLSGIREEALGQTVVVRSGGRSVSAGDHFIKLCHDGLLKLLGEGPNGDKPLALNPKGPTVVLLAGLQGAGKTTHAAKIAGLLQERSQCRPLLVAADVYRPAAREQLKVLGEKLSIPVFTRDDTNDAVAIATAGVAYARQEWRDLVIVDTAGRLAIDEPLMNELERIKAAIEPQNILLVIDSMIGQDAVRTASAFDQRLGLTGVVLTKLDGDTRGGAALSVKQVTGKPIVFLGTGEALSKIEVFRPDGLASRILGMGDVVGLVEDFSKVFDEKEAMLRTEKMIGGSFDFNDFLHTMAGIQKMGPIKDILAKTPLAGQLSPDQLNQVQDKDVSRKTAIVKSMTKQEKANPDLFAPNAPGARSRVKRLALGSGTTEKDVRELIEGFMKMRSMMAMMGGLLGGGGGGLLGKIPGLGGLNQMAQMAKMAKAMGGMGGGMPNLGSLMGGGGFPMGPGAGGRQGLSTAEMAEINRQKKRKKEEKRAKQKKR